MSVALIIQAKNANLLKELESLRIAKENLQHEHEVALRRQSRKTRPISEDVSDSPFAQTVERLNNQIAKLSHENESLHSQLNEAAVSEAELKKQLRDFQSEIFDAQALRSAYERLQIDFEETEGVRLEQKKIIQNLQVYRSASLFLIDARMTLTNSGVK